MTSWTPKDGPRAPPDPAQAPHDAQRDCAGPEPTVLDGPDQAGAARAEISDEALIRRIAESQDRSAFAELFRRYGARIKGYMMRSGAASDLAEEAAQEALLAVWRRAALYKPERATAPAWIFAIARNKRIDLLRRAARAESATEDPSTAPEPPEPAETSLAAEGRDAAVREALDALTQEQRQVVLLAFYEGCAHSEIAERLGLPLGTVKSRLRLSFGKLRDALGADFREELLDI